MTAVAATDIIPYVVIPEECVGCAQCVKGCMNQAIFKVEGEKLWMIDPEECTGCGVCTIYCPTDAIVQCSCN